MPLIVSLEIEAAYAPKIRLRGRGFAIRIFPALLIYPRHCFESHACIPRLELWVQGLDLRHYSRHPCP